jgi:transposase InsO family protein
MVSPARRREAVGLVREKFDVSQRRACRTLGQPRTTERYVPKENAEGRRIAQRVVKLAGENPRYGYRRVAALLRREGIRANLKRVYRIWRLEGLNVPPQQVRRRRTGDAGIRYRAISANHVWSYDFIYDQTTDGRKLKLLTLVDEYTRECLAIEVGRTFKAKAVVEVLRVVMAERGIPDFIRSDNGPEFIARAVRTWLGQLGAKTMFIAPGSPWENPFIESFNGKLRDESLNRELFTSLREAEVVLTEFVRAYNTHRPHSALGYLTPREFAARNSPPEIASASPAGQGAGPAFGGDLAVALDRGGAPAQAATIERNGVQWIDRSIQNFNHQPGLDSHL